MLDLIAQVELIPGVDKALIEASRVGWEAVMLVVIIVAAGLGLWKFGTAIIALGNRYITSTESFLTGMEARDYKQLSLCEQHAENLAVLVALHTTGDIKKSFEEIIATRKDVHQMKLGVVRACEMCRAVAKIMYPENAKNITIHCDAIESIFATETV